MTIFHKQALAGALEVSEDVVVFCKDGTIVAINSDIVYVVEPVKSTIFETKELNNDIGIPIEQVKQLIKNIPVDKQFKGALEVIDISPSEIGNTLKARYHTGKQEAHISMRSVAVPKRYLDWKSLFRLINGDLNIDKHVYNRKRLVRAIAAMEKACQYNGEFTSVLQYRWEHGIIWRALNELTGQHVLILSILDKASGELPFSIWERRIFNMPKVLVIKKKG